MKSNCFRPTQDQREFLFKNYKGRYNKELKELFEKEFNMEVKIDAIKRFKTLNKLDSGLTGHFKKGQASFNKGKKWDDFMSKQGQANSRKTTFKKGNVSKNTKQIGDHYVDSKDGYLYIKVKDKGPRFGRNGMWQQYHHVVWVNHYGPIPDGYVVMFLDRDRTNFNIDNLALVSRSELSLMNKNELFEKNKDINLSLINLIRLTNRFNQIIKENK